MRVDNALNLAATNFAASNFFPKYLEATSNVTSLANKLDILLSAKLSHIHSNTCVCVCMCVCVYVCGFKREREREREGSVCNQSPSNMENLNPYKQKRFQN